MLTVAGEISLTAGAIVVLFVVWLLWWTDVVQHRTQQDLKSQLRNEWVAPTYKLDRVPIGHGVGVLRIPRFGASYEEVIVEGTNVADLRKGPGHISTTANPGAAGNFVVSGHRTTYGKPFNKMADLRTGDVVVVETQTQWLTYQVDKLVTVLPTDYQVTAAIPKESGYTTPGHYVTFTTCTPKGSASHRLIMFGHLVATEPTTDPAYVPRSLRPGVLDVTGMNKQA